LFTLTPKGRRASAQDNLRLGAELSAGQPSKFRSALPALVKKQKHCHSEGMR